MVSTASERPDHQKMMAFGVNPRPVTTTVEAAAPVPAENEPTLLESVNLLNLCYNSYMKITNPDDIKIGHWYTICCHLDMDQIKNDNDLEYAKEHAVEWFIEEEPPAIHIWETQLEALLEIRKGWRDSEVIAEIDELIAGITT